MSELTDAIRLAAFVHNDQFDKAGEPYILHPLRVMLEMDTDEERIVAVLHDVVEDSDHIGHGDILAIFGADVHAAVYALTRHEGEPYPTFIERCKANPLARKVKLADIADNLSPSRRASLPDSLRERYVAARDALASPTTPMSEPGGLHWYPTRAILPVRFTHDRDGYLLRSQLTGRRKSRWFERVLRCDECAWPFKPAYRPAAKEPDA